MDLAELLSAVERLRKDITVYAPEVDRDVVEQFATKNVSVDYRALPAAGPGGFVVLRDDDGFVGSVDLETLTELTSPPIPDVGDDPGIDPAYRALLEVLGDTLFSSFDRRQLLATAREFENRAWRVGDGTLRVGFQNPSALRAQVPTYARLGTETDLDVHVYVSEEWTAAAIPGVTVHAEDAEEIGRFWFLAFDGGGDEANRCGLVAEERSPGEFYGFWTYDPDRVGELLAHLADRYG